MAHVSSWNLPRVCTVIALQCSSMPIKMHSYVIWSTSETLASIWLLLTPRSFCLVATEIHVHFALQKFAYLATFIRSLYNYHILALNPQVQLTLILLLKSNIIFISNVTKD